MLLVGRSCVCGDILFSSRFWIQGVNFELLEAFSVDRGPRRAVLKTEGSRAEPSNPKLDANSQEDQPCSITESPATTKPRPPTHPQHTCGSIEPIFNAQASCKRSQAPFQFHFNHFFQEWETLDANRFQKQQNNDTAACPWTISWAKVHGT